MNLGQLLGVLNDVDDLIGFLENSPVEVSAGRGDWPALRVEIMGRLARLQRQLGRVRKRLASNGAA